MDSKDTNTSPTFSENATLNFLKLFKAYASLESVLPPFPSGRFESRIKIDNSGLEPEETTATLSAANSELQTLVSQFNRLDTTQEAPTSQILDEINEDIKTIREAMGDLTTLAEQVVDEDRKKRLAAPEGSWGDVKINDFYASWCRRTALRRVEIAELQRLSKELGFDIA